MSTEANPRIRQIISVFAGDAKLTAETISSEFVVIPRKDLPECKITERDGETHVDCGSDWGTWNVKHLDRMRETALEYVAAFVAATEWHACAAREAARADELAAKFSSIPGATYGNCSKVTQKAIDYIIELESAA